MTFWLDLQIDTPQTLSFDSADVTIGRDAGCDVVLEDKTVSRQHARIEFDGTNHVLVVLSQNGMTAIGDKQVSGRVTLSTGTTFFIGKNRIVFRSDTAPKFGPATVNAFGSTAAPVGESEARTEKHEAVVMPEESPKKPANDGEIRSWDDIANSAEAKAEAGAPVGETNFERIQKASAKAQAQSSGSPIRLVIAGLAILGLLGFILYEPTVSKNDSRIGPAADAEAIVFKPGELDCVGKADCSQKARKNYKIGVTTLDNENAAIGNRFEGWMRLEMADRFAQKAGIEAISKEFPELEKRRSAAREQLDARFRLLRASFHAKGDQNMHKQQVTILSEVRARFPHKGAEEHQWSIVLERQMKERGDYPRGP